MSVVRNDARVDNVVTTQYLSQRGQEVGTGDVLDQRRISAGVE